jgi:xanthine dehydrogenase accessory factor
MDLRSRAEALRGERVPFVLATVVRASPPTPAKPGDEALVLEDGTVLGFVGGECVHSRLVMQAIACVESGEAVLMRVVPHPGGGTSEPGTVAFHNPCLSGGALEIFLRPVLPPAVLVIHGSAPIARALASLASAIGEAVAPWDGSLPEGTTAVVVASHGRGEEPVLEAAVRAGVPYVGLVASRRRGKAVVAGLDLSDSERERIRTPAGLDLGARTPGEVAVSILAEMVAALQRGDHPGRGQAGGGSQRGDRALTGRASSSSRDGAGAARGQAVDAAVDPVCGMPVEDGEASPYLDHEGARYWFCGTGCRRAFAADRRPFLERQDATGPAPPVGSPEGGTGQSASC